MQSFWNHPELLKFKKYTDKLVTKGCKGNDVTMKNWQKGLKQMQQLAISYGVQYQPENPFGDSTPIPLIPEPDLDETKWVNIPDVGIVGITDKYGDVWKKDGKYIFSAKWLDFMMDGITDGTKYGKVLMKIIKTFDGIPVYGKI